MIATCQQCSSAPPGAPSVSPLSKTHQLGDGLHLLPVMSISPAGIQPLNSEGSILYLFLIWAQERNVDASEIHERACPEQPGLRPDRLLLFRMWTEIPEDRIDTNLLCHDLESAGFATLAQTLRDIASGTWEPTGAFTHWVVTERGEIAGEARDLDPPDEPDSQGQYFSFVRLFAMPDLAEWGYSNAEYIVRKKLRTTKETSHGHVS